MSVFVIIFIVIATAFAIGLLAFVTVDIIHEKRSEGKVGKADKATKPSNKTSGK